MSYRKSLLLFALLACGSCSGGSGGGAPAVETGTLSLLATDAPLDHDMVEEALVRIDRVRAHREADAESGFQTLYEGPPRELNLMNLNNGATWALVNADLPVGDYRQFRLHVASARLELTNGNVYSTEDGSLKLTSQATSGFKVFVDPPVSVAAQLSTEVLLDFDLSKTFLPTPANDPPNATSFRLHPVIRVANLSEAGEVRGGVFEDDGLGGLSPIEKATIYVLPPGETDRGNSLASTASDGDGSYAILGVPAGSYDILAAKDLLVGRVDGVSVSIGNVSAVDVIVE